MFFKVGLKTAICLLVDLRQFTDLDVLWEQDIGPGLEFCLLQSLKLGLVLFYNFLPPWQKQIEDSVLCFDFAFVALSFSFLSLEPSQSFFGEGKRINPEFFVGWRHDWISFLVLVFNFLSLISSSLRPHISVQLQGEIVKACYFVCSPTLSRFNEGSCIF